jgi:serine/threonine protein kinase
MGLLIIYQEEATGDRFAVPQNTPTIPYGIDKLLDNVHPCVLPVREIVYAPGKSGPPFAIPFYGNGTVSDVLEKLAKGEKVPWWNPTFVTKAIVGIALAMRFIHARREVHRDLRLVNLVVDSKKEVRISDFGSGVYTELAPNVQVSAAKYMAPELLQNAPHNEKVDVYSYGMVVYEMLAERRAFPNVSSIPDLLKEIDAGTLPPFTPSVNRPMQGLLRKCWSEDPNARPSFDQILEQYSALQFRVMEGFDESAVFQFIRFITAWEAAQVQ